MELEPERSPAPAPTASEDDTLVGDVERRAPAEMPRLARGTTVGRYVLLEPLGAGGMGVVYAAFDPQLDRRIALKLLRPDPDGSSGSWGGPERLLREAQALARLSHPNVIAVHDVGTWQGEVFVAMELVDGQTLTSWRAQRPRSWREILGVFRSAGAGLAAAHGVGIVHRDFKPDNVMISRDERVHVLDFGLARPPGALSAASIGDLHRTDESTATISVDTRLTLTGALLGTPAYMAPEQHGGEGATAQTDQFSFCVALYEALYGERPFGGETAAALAFNVLHGRPREAPASARVPRWLRRVLLRGLAVRPQERWPSMDALLRELERDPQTQRRRSAAAAAVVLLVAIGAYAWGSREAPAPVCQAGRRLLEDAWNDELRAAAAGAFTATGRAYAADAWTRTRTTLDAYAQAWLASYDDACEATHLRKEQSERMLDLRMGCLEQRRHQLAAAGRLLAQADEDVVRRAQQIAVGLPSLSACSDLEQLSAGAEPPASSARAQVDALREQLGELAALVDAGKYEAALSSARSAVDAAVAIDYPPIEAEASFWLGYTLEKTGDPEGAVEPLSHAAFTAQASRHDAIAARAMTVLVFVIGERLARTDEGLAWARHAHAAVTRVGDPLAEAELLNDEGTVLVTAGRFEQARERFEQALALRERELGAEHFLVGRVLNNLGTALEGEGRLADARVVYERALEVAERTVGPEHPDLGIRLTNLGEMLARMGDTATARSQLERARTIFAHSVGERHHYYASATNNLATVAVAEGDLEQALRLMEQSKATWIALMGPEHPEVALCELNIGSIATQAERHEDALTHLQTALRLYRAGYGDDHPDVASVHVALAVTLTDLGDHAGALDHARTAVRILEAHVAPEHPELGTAHKRVGLALLALDRGHEALAPLERARAIARANDGDGDELAALDDAIDRAR